MATHGWRTGRTIEDQLLDEGSGFNFFQLFRLLDMDAMSSGKEGLGQGWKISADLDAAFPATEIRDVSISNTSGADKTRVAKTSNYCIAGYSGPLPENFTDWMREQQRYGLHGMTDFLDIFNHRINLLRYEAKKQSHTALDTGPPVKGLIAPGLSAAMGMHDSMLSDQLPLSRRSILSLASLLSNKRVSAVSIQKVLSKCFGFKTRVTDLIGAWKNIASDQICRLGEPSVSSLGELSILGQKNMDMQARVRVEIGPVELNTYLALLPDFEFSGKNLILPVRSFNDITVKNFDGRQVSYKLAPNSADTTSMQTEGGNSQFQVSNVLLEIDSELDRERVFSPSLLESDAPTGNTLRATRFAGYLHRHFSSLVKYLTNFSVDAEVFLTLDPETLPQAYMALKVPSSTTDARLRLGQSFWLGKPKNIDKLERKKSRLERLYKVWGDRCKYLEEQYRHGATEQSPPKKLYEYLGKLERALAEVNVDLDVAKNARARFVIQAFDENQAVMQ